MVRRAEEEIAKAETECRATQPGSGHGGYGSRKQNRYQPYQGGWNCNQDNNKPAPSTPDHEVLAWHCFGRSRSNRGEVPPQVVATPRHSKEITKNDNYCASSVQDL